jgi:BioD-like phosphotransacetylase family protein
MTPTEQDKELREQVLTEFKQVHKLAPADYTENCTNVVMSIVQDHTNAEIAKVLERLEAELNEQKKAAETNLAYHVDVTKNERLIRDWQGTVHGIEFCRPAIAAERAKLKEVK